MPTMIFDVDGDGTVQALSDAVLIMRYFSGLRGDDLIDGAVEVGAVRATAAEIESYIQGIWNYLDIDGDGDVGWGDVLILFRYLLGFTGDTLIDTTVNAGATRPTAELIVAYLEQFTEDIE